MNLDEQLQRIGALPVPDLAAIDGAALAAQAAAAARRSRVVIASVLAGALALGAALQPAPRGAAPVVPFGPPVAQTPLVLLG